MNPLILSAAGRVFIINPPILFSVMISVTRPDGSFVTDLNQNSFDFGYFPTSDKTGVGLMGLVTKHFENYAQVPKENAPGCYGISLVFDDLNNVNLGYTPMLFVTVTELAPNPGASGKEPAAHISAQGQIVIYPQID